MLRHASPSPRTRGAALLALSMASALACAPAQPEPVEPPAQAPLPAAEELVEARVLSRRVRAPKRPEVLYSQRMLDFVGGDEVTAVRLALGLQETAGILSRARCSSANRAEPEALRAAMEPVEGYLLYVALFALAYEFDFGGSPRVEDGRRQTLAILNALSERLDSSEVLFPKLELLTPEDAALMVESEGASDRSLFPTYVELLYSMVQANADLADKKSRIAAKVEELREAVSVLLRRKRLDATDLCLAIASLDDAAQSAQAWAVGARQRGGAPSLAAVYEVEVRVALTNVSSASASPEPVMVQPFATLRALDGSEAPFEVELEDLRLTEPEGSGAPLDNNLPPGFTQVRTLRGVSNRGVAQLCAVEGELLVGGHTLPLAVPLDGC